MTDLIQYITLAKPGDIAIVSFAIEGTRDEVLAILNDDPSRAEIFHWGNYEVVR